MANKTKPAKSKRHTNPKGRVALFCYVTPATLKAIKCLVRRPNSLFTLSSQGHVVDIAVSLLPDGPAVGSYKRPIA